jgi:predicted GNAT family acetyltransferase
VTREIRDNPQQHRFELAFDDGSFAFAEYRLGEGTILFPHTIVPAGHEGQGIGTRLVEAALAATRESGLRVIPRCSFFVRYMKKHPETHDLLDEQELARLTGSEQ